MKKNITTLVVLLVAGVAIKCLASSGEVSIKKVTASNTENLSPTMTQGPLSDSALISSYRASTSVNTSTSTDISVDTDSQNASDTKDIEVK